jgi:glycosylphosphatidylinositol transamidase
MSNLHERLHHSVAQYTMPSLVKFVSHGEYIFPAILVSLPMVGRAAMLALRDLKRFRFFFALVVTGVVCVMTIGVGMWSLYWSKGMDVQGDASINMSALIVYLVAHLLVVYIARRIVRTQMSKSFQHHLNDDEMATLDDFHNSLRFLACIFGVYLHVPLLLANYSLGFSSSLFWTPLLAIFVIPPSKCCGLNRWLRLAITLTKFILLVATFPPVLLVPRIFGSYTNYVTVVYTPLNLMLSALWMSV